MNCKLERLVRRLWSCVSCWHCSKFGARLDCLVERPDGLHDQMMLCPKCAGKPVMELQREIYMPNDKVCCVAPDCLYSGGRVLRQSAPIGWASLLDRDSVYCQALQRG